MVNRFRVPDSTVLAYLGESLECFSRGTMVASVMMLGIASERVFLLICDSLAESLQDSAERTEFEKVLARNAMKPKLDWVSQKFQKIDVTDKIERPFILIGRS